MQNVDHVLCPFPLGSREALAECDMRANPQSRTSRRNITIFATRLVTSLAWIQTYWALFPCLVLRMDLHVCFLPSLPFLHLPAAIPSFIFRFPHLILPVTFHQLQEEGPMLHGLRGSKLCRFSQVDWQVDVESNCSMWFPKSPEARRFAW